MQHFLNLALLGIKKLAASILHLASLMPRVLSFHFLKNIPDHSDSDYNILQLSCQLRRATVKVGSLLLGIITWKKWKKSTGFPFCFAQAAAVQHCWWILVQQSLNFVQGSMHGYIDCPCNMGQMHQTHSKPPCVWDSVPPYMRLEVCKPKFDIFKPSMVSILKLFSKSISILNSRSKIHYQKILTEIHLKKILQQNFRAKKNGFTKPPFPPIKVGKKLWSIGPRSWCPYLSFKALASKVDHPSSLGLRQPKATELPQIATRKPRCEGLKEIIRVSILLCMLWTSLFHSYVVSIEGQVW